MHRSPSARDALARLQAQRGSSHAYRALSLGEPSGSYVALDLQDRPALFMPVEGHPEGPIQRANDVSLRLGARCKLYLEARENISGAFDVLQCESSDSITVDTFVLLLDALLDRLRSGQVADDYLTTFFRTLARLFSVRPASDPAKERQGLWGELLAMQLLGGVSSWASFWHTDPYKRFDFSTAHRRIEVKTTTGDARAHSFAHRQLFTTGNEEVAIASFMLRHDPNGLSLQELITRGRRELSKEPSQLAKLEAATRSARMSDPQEAGPSFNESDARSSLVWFWARDAPRFKHPEPPGVSETRYKVDLSATPQVARPELVAWLSEWE